jgi:uncharacterized radical SAM superfamily Fe-S cluster-containing enzyme
MNFRSLTKQTNAIKLNQTQPKRQFSTQVQTMPQLNLHQHTIFKLKNTNNVQEQRQSINLQNINTKTNTNTKTNCHPSLIDSFGRQHTYLRISLTEKCNLRCTYCMPLQGVDLTPNNELLTIDELQRLMTLFVNLGVRKIRFTGGEPLVRKDFDQIIAMAGQLTTESIYSQSIQASKDESDNLHPFKKGLHTIAVTTNGLLLERKLDKLVSAGLNHVNISLDTLDPHMFTLLTRRLGHERVLSAIRASCKQPGMKRVKVNCV